VALASGVQSCTFLHGTEYANIWLFEKLPNQQMTQNEFCIQPIALKSYVTELSLKFTTTFLDTEHWSNMMLYTIMIEPGSSIGGQIWILLSDVDKKNRYRKIVKILNKKKQSSSAPP